VPRQGDVSADGGLEAQEVSRRRVQEGDWEGVSGGQVSGAQAADVRVGGGGAVAAGGIAAGDEVVSGGVEESVVTGAVVGGLRKRQGRDSAQSGDGIADVGAGEVVAGEEEDAVVTEAVKGRKRVPGVQGGHGVGWRKQGGVAVQADRAAAGGSGGGGVRQIRWAGLDQMKIGGRKRLAASMVRPKKKQKGPKDCWEALEQESAGSRRPARNEVVHRLRQESGFPSAND